MYSPTSRVLTVLELLQARGRLSGAELAARLEVDGRSVRRYITALQDLGIPVVGEPGPHGGYSLRPGFRLPPLMLSEGEAIAVTLGLMAGRHLRLAWDAAAAEAAAAKLDRVLPAALREQVRAVQETIALLPGPVVPAPPDAAVVSMLSSAARERHCVWLHYRAWRGELTERIVEPYGLVFNAGRWYLAGRDRLRDAIRTFRLDRIERVEPRDERFARPDGFDAVAHVVRSLRDVPYRWPVTVLLRAPLGEVARRLPITFGSLEETPDGVLLRTRAERLDGMARMLIWLGYPFVICEPAELRDAVRDLAAELATMADRSEPPAAAPTPASA